MRSHPLLATLAAALLVGVLAGPAHAAGPVRWGGSRLADHTAPFSTPSSVSGIACPTSTLCLAVGPAGTVSELQGGQVSTQSGLDHGASLSNIACPSVSLCVVTEPTALLTSTDPSAATPTWTRTAVPLGNDVYAGVTCASASLCVTWSDSSTVEVSTDPTGGAADWRPETLSGQVSSVACVPGTTECVASLAGAGVSAAETAVSTDPAAGASSWSTSGVPGDPLKALSCPSASLCVGIDGIGEVVTSTDPAGGGQTWSAGTVITGIHTGFIGLACAGATECVAAVSDGSIVSSTAPATGAASYVRSAVLDSTGFGTAAINDIACSGPTACLIPDRTPGVATVDPGPPASATIAGGDTGFTALTHLACPSSTICLGTDAGGGIVRSTHPATQTGTWTRTLQPGASGGLAALSCPTTGFCAAVGSDDHLATTAHPATAGRWTQTVLPFRAPNSEGGPAQPYDLTSVSCASARLCVAGNGDGWLMASGRPAGGRHAWHLLKVGAFGADTFGAVACPAAGLCVAGDNEGGRVAASTDPLHHWRLFKIAPGVGSRAPGISAISCPSSRFCLAGDAHGSVHWSIHPARGSRAWHAARIDHRRLIAVSCRSSRLCVAVDDDDRVFATTDPRGRASAWHEVTLPTERFPLGNLAQDSLTSVACAPSRLCVAGTGVGAVFPGVTG